MNRPIDRPVNRQWTARIMDSLKRQLGILNIPIELIIDRQKDSWAYC